MPGCRSVIRRRSLAHLPLAALLATVQYAVAEPTRKPDVPKPDAHKPDSQKPDACTPDGQKPDGQKPDGQTPDARKPDAQQPDPWGHRSDIGRNADGSLVVPVPDSDPSRGAPGYGGGWAAGYVITPPAIADAREYPRGIVIRPPHTGDERTWPNGIWLAPDWGAPTDVLSDLEDRLQAGFGALGKLLTPQRH